MTFLCNFPMLKSIIKIVDGYSKYLNIFLINLFTFPIIVQITLWIIFSKSILKNSKDFSLKTISVYSASFDLSKFLWNAKNLCMRPLVHKIDKLLGIKTISATAYRRDHIRRWRRTRHYYAVTKAPPIPMKYKYNRREFQKPDVTTSDSISETPPIDPTRNNVTSILVRTACDIPPRAHV